MSTLEHAIALAAEAHEGQSDKAGAPCILHPLRMMLKLDTSEERIAAMLHDVVEDSGWTLARLRAEGFSETVLGAIDAVTRRPDEGYENYMSRASSHPVGRRVKLADLEDNSDLSRIPNPTERDFVRVEKYRKAIALLRMQTG